MYNLLYFLSNSLSAGMYVTPTNACCTFPPCRRPQDRCDYEHSTPYEKGGRTCLCDAGPVCRRNHRNKQAPGWHLEHAGPAAGSAGPPPPAAATSAAPPNTPTDQHSQGTSTRVLIAVARHRQVLVAVGASYETLMVCHGPGLRRAHPRLWIIMGLTLEAPVRSAARHARAATLEQAVLAAPLLGAAGFALDHLPPVRVGVDGSPDGGLGWENRGKSGDLEDAEDALS